MAKVHVDVRECKLIKLLEGEDIIFEQLQLPIADIVISYDGAVIAAIERKTVSDLCASIKDSRYKEQKERLSKAYSKDAIMYVIEGEWNDHMDEMAKGAIINTMFRDKIKVFMTPSTSGTARLLCDIYKRIEKNPNTYTGNEEVISDYVDSLSQVASIAKKRDLMDTRTFSILSLSLIPGVSKVTAKAIVDSCGNIGDIILDDTKIASIADIKLTSGKRIGKVIASRIATFCAKK